MVLLHFIVTIGVCCFATTTNAAPCKNEDTDCIKNEISEVMKTTFDGVPVAGIEPLDPFFIESINASLASVKIMFRNVTVEGLKKCKISAVRASNTSLDWDMMCPSLAMNSKYEANGQVLILPVNGKGDAQAKTGKISITIQTKRIMVKKPDGTNHLQLVDSKVTANPIEPTEFGITNLFNEKLLTDAFLLFARENWKLISDLLLEPFMQPGLEEVLKRINKYFETLKTYEDFVIE